MLKIYTQLPILVCLALCTSSSLLAMLNPRAGMLARLNPEQSTTSSFMTTDESERQRLENLATTPEQWIKNNIHAAQRDAARNRVFGGNWPEDRLPNVFEILDKRQAHAKAEQLAHTLELYSSDEQILNQSILTDLQEALLDPALPEKNRDKLLELFIRSRKKPLLFPSAIEFGTANGRPVELCDLSEMVQRQSGSTCGYHAVHNIKGIFDLLSGNNHEDVGSSLAQGPPLELFKNAVKTAGSGEEENICDDDIRLLLSLADNLQPDQLIIIPNLHEWTPSLDEKFATVAQHLQDKPGTLQGFLINTARHIQATAISPKVSQEIIDLLASTPNLQQAFIANQEQQIPLSYDDENSIVQKLFETNKHELITNKHELISTIRNLNKTGHSSVSGHWTAIAARNNNGTLQLFAADSMCDPETKSFGNLGTLQTLRDWITTPPAILQALTDIPNKLETAINVMEQNRDLKKGLDCLTQATDIIERTPNLIDSPHYRTVIAPLAEKANALINGLILD